MADPFRPIAAVACGEANWRLRPTADATVRPKRTYDGVQADTQCNSLGARRPLRANPHAGSIDPTTDTETFGSPFAFPVATFNRHRSRTRASRCGSSRRPCLAPSAVGAAPIERNLVMLDTKTARGKSP